MSPISILSTPLLPCATTPQLNKDDVKIPIPLPQTPEKIAVEIEKDQTRTTIIYCLFASIFGFWLGINADVVLDLFVSIAADSGAWPVACMIVATLSILLFVVYSSISTSSSLLETEKPPVEHQTLIKIEEPNH
jgi:hypothetical protein